jgi:hypothetical protein
MLDTLILINPHMRNARLPKAERYGGFGRNVDDATTDKWTSPNDRDDHATAVTEVEDPHPRSYRQVAVRRDHPSPSAAARGASARGKPIFLDSAPDQHRYRGVFGAWRCRIASTTREGRASC